MPSRVTLNDTKRLAWFSDLADPDVPLHKLGKSVPHGAKGHDLLDLLQSNNVAISRAVWFLRVFGANETVMPLFQHILLLTNRTVRLDYEINPHITLHSTALSGPQRSLVISRNNFRILPYRVLLVLV